MHTNCPSTRIYLALPEGKKLPKKVKRLNDITGCLFKGYSEAKTKSNLCTEARMQSSQNLHLLGK